MRIVFLNPVAEFGGAERSLLAWMQALVEAQPIGEVHIVLPGEGLLKSRALSLGIKVHTLSMPARIVRLGDTQLRNSSGILPRCTSIIRLIATVPGLMLYSRQLRRLLEALQPDIVHSNGLKCHLFLHAAGWHKGTVVWHLHDFVSHRPVMKRLLAWASRRVAVAVAVSRAVAEDARRILPSLPIKVVYNVTDTNRFSPCDTDGAVLDILAAMPPPPRVVVRVVLVATYARWKGHDTFLEAAALCQDPSTNIRFYIVGGPIYRTSGSQFSESELRALAARLGVDSCIGFIGYQEDPALVYRAADIVIHASTRPEPFGLTIVEAMACGRAIVVAYEGGVKEIATDTQDCLGFKSGQANELASAILKLCLDKHLRCELGCNARETVLSRFAFTGLPQQVVDLYEPLWEPNSPHELMK